MKTVFGDRIAPTLVSCTLISEQGLRDSETAGSFCIPLSAHPQKGMQNMKLQVRYDESCQIIEFDETTEDLAWLGLDFEGEDISPEEREKRIQEAFDEQYNKPEYNNWHKHARHSVPLGLYCDNGDDGSNRDYDPLVKSVSDKRLLFKDELDREERAEYEDTCDWIRTVLKDKPQWSAAFIAVRIDGEKVKDYAATIGVDPTTVTHWLRRAEKS